MLKENLYKLLSFLPVLLFAGVIYLYFNGEQYRVDRKIFCEKEKIYNKYVKMLDTIHLLGDEYIEILLKKQIAVLHRRNDTALVYKISTGNKYLSKGMATPPGFFTIQTRLEVATSRQFNNAKLFYWLGFNGNIGFHGLKSSGYYYHLGRRPSSHGCVRIARDDAKDLYRRVQKGTPVIVYKDTPAVRIAFADISEFDPESDFFLGSDSRYNNFIMKMRLKYLRQGLALTYNRGRPFLDGKTVMKPRGFVIGIDTLIPERQKPPLYKWRALCIEKDNLQNFKYYVYTLNVASDTSRKK